MKLHRLLIPIVVGALFIVISAAALAYSSQITQWTIIGGDGVENSPCTQLVDGVCRGWLVGMSWSPPEPPAAIIVTQHFTMFDMAVSTYTLNYTITNRSGSNNKIRLETPCGNADIYASPPRVATTTIVCSTPIQPGSMDFVYNSLAGMGNLEMVDVALVVEGGPPNYPFQFFLPIIYHEAGLSSLLDESRSDKSSLGWDWLLSWRW